MISEISTLSLATLGAAEQAALTAQAEALFELASRDVPSHETETSFALYSGKLQLLASLGVLAPPILYPVAGVDFFVAAFGETTTIDSNRELVASCYLDILRHRVSRWASPPPLPPDTSNYHTVRADLEKRGWEISLDRRFQTIFLKGLASIIAPPRTDSCPLPVVSGLAEKLLPGGAFILFDDDHERLGFYLEQLGFSEVRFPSPLQEALETPWPYVYLFVGPGWETMVGLQSGTIPHVFRRRGETVSRI